MGAGRCERIPAQGVAHLGGEHHGHTGAARPRLVDERRHRPGLGRDQDEIGRLDLRETIRNGDVADLGTHEGQPSLKTRNPQVRDECVRQRRGGISHRHHGHGPRRQQGVES